MSDVLSPFQLGKHRLANRCALAPLTNLQSPTGMVSDQETAWLRRCARGGFALVSTAAAYVGADGRAWDGQIGIDHDDKLPALTQLAQALSDHGAVGIVQLFHGGVRASMPLTGARPWSASEFTESTPDFVVPRAATSDDIARVIAQFADAAARAERAGFAGVELHAAHGYLLSQFLSTTFNQRSDQWGGDADGRARLVRACLAAARAKTQPGFLIGVRISLEDAGFARGLDLDESVALCAALAKDGADFLHLSLWNAANQTQKRPDQHPLPLVRAAVGAVPLIAAGAVWTRDDANRVLAHGADVVAIGRAAIANPSWPRECADAAWQPRRFPLTQAEFSERAVSPRFVEYLRRWKYVTD